MFRVKCDQCGRETIVVGDPFGAEIPGCVCCTADHVHDESANTCSGEHAGTACPHAGSDLIRSLVHPETHEVTEFHGDEACIAASLPGEPCPGGHCGLGVPGCAVCRPVSLIFLGAAPPSLTGA